MAGMFDFLFQGAPPPSVTSAAQTVQGFPDWYQELIRANVGQAVNVMKEPYQNYQGPRVQGFSGDQQSAFGMVRDAVGDSQPYFDQARGALGQAAGAFDPNRFQSLMNPYMDGVVNRIADLGNRNLMEKILPGVNDTFTSAGHFGSTRHGDFTLRAIRDTQDEILGNQADALMSANNEAMKSYWQQNQDFINSGQQLGALGSMYQNTLLKDAAALEQIGGTQQAFGQKNLDTAYGDFLDQRNWPTQNVNLLNSVIRGFPNPGYTTNQSSTAPASNYQPSPIATIGGLGAMLYGASGQGRT